MRNTIEKALDNHDLAYHTITDTTEQIVYKFGIGLENGRCDTYIDLKLDDSKLIIYVLCLNNVPENRRAKVAEFITRANYGLIIGNFEMDFNDGEIRFKASFMFDDTFPFSEDLFIRNLYTAFRIMDRYYPGLMSIIFSNVSAADAVAQIENSVNPSMN